MQLPSSSQVSHRQYYKATRNSINQGRTTRAAPTGVLPRVRRGALGERSLMQRASGCQGQRDRHKTKKIWRPGGGIFLFCSFPYKTC